MTTVESTDVLEDPQHDAVAVSEDKPWRRWLGRIVDATLVLVLIGSLLVAYGVVDNRWYRIIAIDGSSMSPALQVGDAIVITSPQANLETGMVVTLKVDDQLITHRVVEVFPDGTFATQGDASFARDRLQGKDVRLIGVERLRLPKLGSLLSLLTGG